MSLIEGLEIRDCMGCDLGPRALVDRVVDLAQGGEREIRTALTADQPKA